MKPPAILEATMADLYRVFGAGMSPSSAKVRGYFRYKAAPHQWILRNAESPPTSRTRLRLTQFRRRQVAPPDYGHR
jgi:hypothetical protein